jgi:hypothetical protein
MELENGLASVRSDKPTIQAYSAARKGCFHLIIAIEREESKKMHMDSDMIFSRLYNGSSARGGIRHQRRKERNNHINYNKYSPLPIFL